MSLPNLPPWAPAAAGFGDWPRTATRSLPASCRSSSRLFSWSIDFLNGSGLLLLRLLGVPSTGHRHVHSPEEIELLIAESRDGGLLEPQEQVRLHRALRLGLPVARQLMVPRTRLAAIEVSTPLRDVFRIA